jgi:3',5'-cyclic AMP phosphodiesterase CpdA
MARLLAHCSDLHLGRPGAEEAARALCGTLLEAGVDHLLVTGDLVHSGREEEYALFLEVFAAFSGRMTVVPGNHDRIGAGVAHHLMHGGARVAVAAPPGLYVVRVDSSGPHNTNPRVAHGELSEQDLSEVRHALEAAPPGRLVVVALHHHLLPLPEDSVAERWIHALGIITEHEVARGHELLGLVIGRADLLLHGHRHRPTGEQLAAGGPRPLGIYNAGSSTELCRARLFQHDAGKLVGAPGWSSRAAPPPQPGPAWMNGLRGLTAMFL